MYMFDSNLVGIFSVRKFYSKNIFCIYTVSERHAAIENDTWLVFEHYLVAFTVGGGNTRQNRA